MKTNPNDLIHQGPVVKTDGEHAGLTKLEYMATKIMAALEGQDQHNTSKIGQDTYRTHKANAYMAVAGAKALIAELNKEQNNEQT